MLDGIEALWALERFGTVSEAAAHLRLTQSAVSKRIQTLQNEVGFALTRPEGRRVRLTPEGRHYLERARPLLTELKGLSGLKPSGALTELSLAMSDSIASSWGPAVLKKALKGQTLKLRLHAHRSVLVLENVRLGRYDAGLCALAAAPSDLIASELCSEPFALVFPEERTSTAPLITIEAGSATWRAIEAQVRARPELARRELIRVESFAAALQMVKAGFGEGLIPLGLVREMNVPARRYRVEPRVRRSLFLVTRKSLSHDESFKRMKDRLQVALNERLNGSTRNL